MQKGYDANLHYQRPAQPVHQAVVNDLFQTWDHASAYLGQENHYPDFLAFFQREIDAKGWEAVLSEYLFKKDSPSAEDLFVRLFAGIVHPLIQLMYGIEWKQPAIVAEALAQTCVHQAESKDLLFRIERAANEAYGASPDASKQRMPSIVALHQEARADPKISTAVEFVPGPPGPRFVDTVLKHAEDEMMRILSKVKVWPDEVEERTAEMFDAEVYVAASAALKGPKLGKPPKFDFFLMWVPVLAPPAA